MAALVNYGSVGDFAILDYDITTSGESLLDKNSNGNYTGNVGWISDSEPLKFTSEVTVDGSFTTSSPSGNITLEGGNGQISGSITYNADMSDIKVDALSAVDQFEALVANAAINTVSSGVYSVSAAQTDTVIDLDDFELSGETLNINGSADDFFYFRISDTFSISSSTITLTGGATPANIFYYFSGSDTLSVSSSSITGNIFTKTALVDMSSIDSYKGTVVSGGGFKIQADDFEYIEPGGPVPEPSSASFLILGSVFFLRHRRKISPTIEQN